MACLHLMVQPLRLAINTGYISNSLKGVFNNNNPMYTKNNNDNIIKAMGLQFTEIH